MALKARFYSFFDDIGELITSRAIVIILMAPFMWYRFYEFETLFMKWLPIPDLQSRSIASKLISLVFITITLLFMVNVKRLFKGVKVILALTAFTLNLFFWSLPVAGAVVNWWFIIFISAVISSMDYGQAHLFDAMWKEKQQENDVQDLEDQLQEKRILIAAADQAINNLKPLKAEYEAIRSKCYCDACERMFPSPQARNGHKCKVVN